MYQKDMEQNMILLLLLMLGAYIFSIGLRMYWPIYFGDSAAMMHAGQLMINTNDGYYFSSAARDMLSGISREDAQRASAFGVSEGLVLLTVYATKFTPFSLETVTLYLPAIVSSLIVIPVILIARLIGHTFLGFLAALLASIAWSYYNRTMTGYYDTDMFSVLLQLIILYSFLRIVYHKDLPSILMASFFITIYPYFYSQGVTIVYALFVVLVFYLVVEYFGLVKISGASSFKGKERLLYGTIVLLSIVLMITIPIEYRLGLFLLAFVILFKIEIEIKYLFYLAIATFAGFLVFGNIFDIIWTRVELYTSKGVAGERLYFYQVAQTVREAGSIPMTTVANRISGSSLGFLISILGYILLVIRHKPFIITLPLIGVGLFSYIGGLRFTVYAVPIAALSAIYLFHTMVQYISNKKSIYFISMSLLTLSMLIPNINHILGYKVPTVLNKIEVNDLEKLKEIATSKDYTIAWWDYGYPIWFYSDTNTLIDGGKHAKDNFIVSKILQTDSPDLAANLARLAIETYVDSNYSIVATEIFENTQEDPNLILDALQNGVYPLPSKTRDIYIYLPYRMLNIFPTVMLFGNIDLKTGKTQKKRFFSFTSAVKNEQNLLTFRSGLRFDMRTGELIFPGGKERVKYFIVTQNTKNHDILLQSQLRHIDGEYVVIYMKSYGRFLVVDVETFKSLYVQMFVLGKYDKDLFELVVASPYSRIYKLKK